MPDGNRIELNWCKERLGPLGLFWSMPIEVQTSAADTYGCQEIKPCRVLRLDQHAKDLCGSAMQGSAVQQAMLIALTGTAEVHQPLMQWLVSEAERKVT